jgi:hypothetical protein
MPRASQQPTDEWIHLRLLVRSTEHGPHPKDQTIVSVNLGTLTTEGEQKRWDADGSPAGRSS